MSPRPARLHRFWEGLPAEVQVIQAAYARHPDGRILLFSGERGPGQRWGPRGVGAGRPCSPACPAPPRPAGPQFWVFQDRQLEGAPRPLTELGLPAGEEVDAVFSWPLNGKTYLIRGGRYWRYDEAAARADPGYPRDLSLWEGAPHAPDDVSVSNAGGRRCWEGLEALGTRRGAVLGVSGSPREGRGAAGEAAWTGPRSVPLSRAGDTYFFKGAHYWRFPKGSVKAEPDSPQPMGPKWLDCPAPSAGPHVPRPPKATLKPGTCDCSCEINEASGRPSLSFLLSLLALLVGGVASP